MNIIIRPVRIGLAGIGAWPGFNSSKLLFVLFGAILSSLTFQLSNLILVFKELDLLMNNLGTFMPMMSVVLKLAAFRLKYGSIKILISEMMEDRRSRKDMEEREVMLKNTKIAVYLSYVIALCYNGLVFSYLAIAAVSYYSESIEDRQLVLQATYPFNVKESPIFEIVCIVQFTIAFFTANGHVVIEGLLTASVLHVSTKASSVCKEISEFSEICLNGQVKVEDKRKLITKHLNFLNFVELIEDIFSYVSLFHLLLMTLINCIVGYMLINLTSLNQDNIFTFLMCVAYMLTALAAVASYCVAGEYITSQGTRIFDQLYLCPWYRFKPEDRKILILMFMRSRKPVTISVGDFGSLSMIYFTQILKTSASYLSLVRASSV